MQVEERFIFIYVPLPDLYFDSFSYPVASIVFGDMAIVTLFLLSFLLANPRSCMYGKVQAGYILPDSSTFARKF